MEYVFVYGTLRKGGRLHEAYLVDKQPVIEGVRVRGDLFSCFGSFPCALPGDGEIVGEIYAMSADELKYLDHLEGHPHWYKREKIDLHGADIHPWIYWGDNVEHHEQIKSGDWLEYVEAA